MPLADIAPEYTESVKTFETPNDLAKAYHELNGKVTSGDISLLPEDIRKDPTVSNYKNVTEIAKGLIETKKLVGQIKKAPETPDGYKFTPVKDLHKGLANVEGTQKALANMFHKYGLHGEQADGLQQEILGSLSKGLQKNDDDRVAKGKDVETKLRNEWGQNYDKNLGTVVNVLKRAGAENLANSIGGDPVTLQAMAKITSLLSEDSIGKLGMSTSGGDTKSKEGALKRIKEITDTPDLRKKVADGDPVLVKEWSELHATAYSN